MTIDEIKTSIQEIKDIARCDDEGAHSQEADLRYDFIEYVATLKDEFPGLAEKAKLVLTTKDIGFSRWHA